MIKRSFSNLFLSLLDPFERVIITKTSGLVKEIGSTKKKKISPHAGEFIVRAFAEYFTLYDITSVIIILKCRVSAHIFLILKELMVLGIKINGYMDRRAAGHNGMRARKIRRV